MTFDNDFLNFLLNNLQNFLRGRQGPHTPLNCSEIFFVTSVSLKIIAKSRCEVCGPDGFGLKLILNNVTGSTRTSCDR